MKNIETKIKVVQDLEKLAGLFKNSELEEAKIAYNQLAVKTIEYINKNEQIRYYRYWVRITR